MTSRPIAGLYNGSIPKGAIIAVSPDASPCMKCFDFREPNFNTVIYGDTRKGFLPAGSYNFTQEGRVVNAISGMPLDKNSLFARTDGPIMGPTMGACVSRAVQSPILNHAGSFNPIPSAKSRGCYV